MRTIAVTLYVLAGLGLLAGALLFTVSQSAAHETEALIALLIGAVCFSGGAQVSAAERVEAAINRGTHVAINEAKMAELRQGAK